MCAISGIVLFPSFIGNWDLQSTCMKSGNLMHHRGPDDSGLWVSSSQVCALSHKRLSVIDLSTRGRQPMANENGTVWVTFNGEIYNFKVLRKQLEQLGHVFRTNSDTEVLSHLFETMDPSNIKKLDGMYAFGVWSEQGQRLILARDPFGKKPLYYSEGPGWFAFASELHALRVIPGFDARINPEALSLYLLTGYVPSPHTIYQGAKKLPPGHYLEMKLLEAGQPHIQIGRHADFVPKEQRRFLPIKNRRKDLRGLLIEAVEKRLVADVPLGAFLSGGVDSSLVAAIATRELGRSLKTFTIGFEGTNDSEHLFAREISRQLGTEHHEKILKPDAVSLLDEIAERLDEPNGDSSCLPTLLLSRHAKEHVTVALSGDGGDELFGGYGRYRDTLKEYGGWGRRVWRSLGLGKAWTASGAYLSPRWLIFQPQQVERLVGGLPAGTQETLKSWTEILEDRSRPLLHRMRYLDAHTYLPGAVLAKVDRMSMQVALEVRCPLLDRNLREFSENLASCEGWKPPDQTKVLLKQLASDYLPQDWMNRPKMGFGLPTNAWSKPEVLKLAKERLSETKSYLSQIVCPQGLKDLITEQGGNGKFSIYQIWPLLVLEAWLKKNMG